ncbi:MAG TPA: hypothetical protein VNG12_27735 [Acidimicrobiales bacterium]|nr:hypothetical protein [Acidimicrobiales bacterium]
MAYAAYFASLSSFSVYDDEGYWLIALRSYHLHGSLYHNTFAPAGPFYYEAFSGIYSLFGMSVNWDTGRLVTTVVWLLTSLVFGIAIWVLTRRAILGLLAQIVAYLVMFLLFAIPMEPAGLAHLLGAFVLLGLAFYVRGRRYSGMVIVGAASAASVFTKVNIGVFISIGLTAAAVIHWPSHRWMHARKGAVAIGLLAFPLVVMRPVLSMPWAENYLGLEGLYLVGIAAIVLTRTSRGSAFAVRHVAVGLAAAVVSTVLIAVGVLINGTSLTQLVHGAIFAEQSLAKINHIALPVSGTDLVLAAASTFVAIAVAVGTATTGSRPRWIRGALSGYARFAAGVWILGTISSGYFSIPPRGLVLSPLVTLPVPAETFRLAAPFAWMAAIGGSGEEDGRSSFVRVAICLVGVLGCLEGYPIAGSQMLWAAVMLIPVAVLCITDGLSIISQAHKKFGLTPRRAISAWLGTVVPGALILSLGFGNIGKIATHYHRRYDSNEPVTLLGAEDVRLPRGQVEQLVEVTAYLTRNCSSYWSAPGLNSFYFLSGEPPPSGLNTSQMWWNLLDRQEQDRVLVQLKRTSRLCLVESPQYGIPLALRYVHTPLAKYLEQQFVLRKTIGIYDLFERR